MRRWNSSVNWRSKKKPIGRDEWEDLANAFSETSPTGTSRDWASLKKKLNTLANKKVKTGMFYKTFPSHHQHWRVAVITISPVPYRRPIMPTSRETLQTGKESY